MQPFQSADVIADDSDVFIFIFIYLFVIILLHFWLLFSLWPQFLVLCCCWLGDRKVVRPVKNSVPILHKDSPL